MKKLILLLIIFISLGLNNSIVYWDEAKDITVIVTEEIPWAECKPQGDGEREYPTYECRIEKGTQWVFKVIWAIVKWFSYLAWLVWVVFIVYNGILYSMWWADQSLKDESKKRIIWTLLWLVLLFLSWPILQLIAPWIYK